MAGSLKRQALPEYRLEYLGMFCQPYALAPNPPDLPQSIQRKRRSIQYAPNLQAPAPAFIYFDLANPFSLLYSLNQTIVTGTPSARVSSR